MANIKCCYVTCSHNSVILTIEKDGVHWDSDTNLGCCNCADEEIILGSHECTECGEKGEGMDCKNFTPKSLIKNILK